ncbi:16S rRNA (guanine(966)-N(2))-methyltransferase RsmD [uncultured Paraglaciecola sp.]|uniref:16S rRNA (guanine(966)-N(2))-methyltransferase RsmD n=1 Tax=uncultured Paraglaciecola sp. TaxID=1765024 RepID=UPI0030DD182D|tara:strand:- start:207805 stop:208419 length:615 start_codon:yes stop_codon:yes gene_type:complete
MKRGEKQSLNSRKLGSSKPSGMVRIISGRFRGRKLPVLDVQGLRPTTDKNREMLFSWLMAYTSGASCLDAFAGSGGLGFEALSRYGDNCTFIELDKMVAKKVADNIQLLGLSSQQAKIIQGNTLDVLNSLNQTYELIFLDPPFNQNLLPATIERIVDKSLLAIDGVIYIECEASGKGYSVPENWQMIKEKRSAQILARVYQRID